MSNVCYNQLVTNTDEELDFLNNDDPVPVMNIFDSRTPVEKVEYLENVEGQYDDSITSNNEDNDNLYDTQPTSSNLKQKPIAKDRPYGVNTKQLEKIARKTRRSKSSPHAS